MLVDMRTATITSKGQVVIPKDVRKGDFKTGSKIAILAYQDRIELRPIKQVSDSMRSALATEKVLAKGWNTKQEDEAWKHL